MLNRSITIAILASISIFTFLYIGIKFGLYSINNWLMILATSFFCLAAYRVLGMVEGYKE